MKQLFTFTGREYDEETGLYYYRARYYDSETGRFISEDPIGFKGSINLYLYTGNNPVNFIVPLGLEQRVVGSRNGQPIVYDTKTGQYALGHPGSYVDPITGVTRDAVKTTGQAVDKVLNNPVTEITDTIPPGESTGYPTVDILMNVFQIVKEGLNRLKKACQ